MIIDLVGVVPDGSPASDRVPKDVRVPVTVQAGIDFTVRLTLMFVSGQRVPLGSGSPAATLTVRRKPGDTAVLQLAGSVIPTEGPGRINFVGAASATQGKVDFGRYVYDIAFTQSGKKDVVIPLSPWIFEPSLS